MIIPKKKCLHMCQSEIELKKSQKNETNLQKNSTVYFQIGLIVVLLTIYGLFEMKFETTNLPDMSMVNTDNNKVFIEVSHIRENIPEVTDVDIKEERNRLSVISVVVPDNIPISELKDPISDGSSIEDKPFNINDIILVDKPDEPNVAFERVEQVPVYPGCENKKTNEDKRKCMSDKINKLVQKNFDGNIAPDYGFSGMQRISVEFKIDKTGHVTDIKTRAPHPKLEEEALRIINKIPDMQPGMQRDKPVGVVYSLPIVFKVQN